jgi:vacuolar-type H+-ATPase subunit E/Vma4
MTELADTPSGAEGSSAGYAEVGERIAAILNAAEASAEQIRTHARDEAAEILRHAHETAASRVTELTREPERLRDEAQAHAHATRTAADDYAAETRQTAETHARQLVDDAEREADELRAAAQAEVRRIEEEGRRRQRELTDQIRALHGVRDDAVGALQAATGGLREAAQRLESQVLPIVDADAESAFERDAGARPWSRLFKRETPPVVLNGDGAHVEDAESPSDDLYERAKELGIRGRSKMSRDELEAAVQQALGAAGD